MRKRVAISPLAIMFPIILHGICVHLSPIVISLMEGPSLSFTNFLLEKFNAACHLRMKKGGCCCFCFVVRERSRVRRQQAQETGGSEG